MSRASTKSGRAAGLTKPASKAKRPDAGKLAGKGAGHRKADVPRTLTQFMAQALAMENEASQRYSDLADAMEMHNNREAAAMFRKLAGIERKHATRIMSEMGWTDASMPPSAQPGWTEFEAPETTPGDEVHYLMQPYHAMQIALVNEQRAQRFFAQLARTATVEAVSTAARELEAEEREHVKLVRAWMKKLPKPDRYWADDPDPATYTD